MTAKVAMISGASRGIGAAVAAELAARGWLLSLGVRRPGEFTPPESALAFAYDAVEAGSATGWVAATADRFGRIDAVVANAGIMIPKTVIEANDADLDALLEVNVKAPLRLIRAAWPWLVQGGEGRVATIVSLSGKRVKAARSGLYSVSKFAALGLAHAIRHAGWEEGVRSVAICPGFVATDMAMALSPKDPATMTQPADLARLVAMTLELPNTASVAELVINCSPEESF